MKYILELRDGERKVDENVIQGVLNSFFDFEWNLIGINYAKDMSVTNDLKDMSVTNDLKKSSSVGKKNSYFIYQNIESDFTYEWMIEISTDFKEQGYEVYLRY